MKYDPTEAVFHNNHSTVRNPSDIETIVAQGKEIEQLKAAQQWISVEDELPKPTIDKVWASVNVLCDDLFVRQFDYHTKHNYWSEGLSAALHKVTHWMPLPTPPEGE